MQTEPEFENRARQPYAFITFIVTMRQMKRPADKGFPALFAALAKQGIVPTGAPFFNYRRIDMAATLEVEAGMPVDHVGQDDGEMRFGILPAGRFATMTHRGPYKGLYEATGRLIHWARETGVAWDMHSEPDGDHFACRLEIYETDPSAVPNPKDWITRLAFKTAG